MADNQLRYSLAVLSILGFLPSCKETDAVGKAAKGSLCDFYLFYTAANITVGPSSVPALFGTPVNFTCEGKGDVVEWTVDGNSLTDPSNQERVISVTTNNISVDMWSSVLTIRALPLDSNVILNIGCTIISYSPVVQDESGAILTVKGNVCDKSDCHKICFL